MQLEGKKSSLPFFCEVKIVYRKPLRFSEGDGMYTGKNKTRDRRAMYFICDKFLWVH